jgi:hypothetical protein
MIAVGIVLIGLGVLFFWLAKKKKQKQQRLMATTALSINQLQPNAQAEIKGTIVAQRPLQTPFSHRDCVYYSYDVEQEVPERNQDGRLEYRWSTIDSNTELFPFTVRDQTGEIAVVPERAKIDAENFGEQYLNAGSFDQQFPSLHNRFRFGQTRTKASEKALLAGSSVYIFGYVTQGVNGLLVQKGNDDFIISCKSEEQVEKTMGRSAIIMQVLGVILAIFGIIAIISNFTK